MELIVGTDSTWSLRAWLCLKLAGIEASEKVIDLGSENYKLEILKYSPTGLVPALITDKLVIHDSLSITEYLNECCNNKLYPENVYERALARSLCAEMHTGFSQLRLKFPFTLKSFSKEYGMPILVQNELTRIEQIFNIAELPYMFKSAGAVDAFYSILAFRLNSYGITFDGKAGQYQKSLLDWSLLNKAISQARLWENTVKIT